MNDHSLAFSSLFPKTINRAISIPYTAITFKCEQGPKQIQNIIDGTR